MGCFVVFDFGDYSTNAPPVIDASADTVITTAALGDFTFSAPDILVANAGETTKTAIAISRLDGFAAPVALAISGLPLGVTSNVEAITFAPNALSATLEITVPATLTPQSSPLTLTAVGASRTHAATIDLRIQHGSGSLDVSFGTAGIATASMEGFDAILNSMAIDSSDRIAVGGVASAPPNKNILFLTVLEADGAPTPSFNSGIPLRAGDSASATTGIVGVVRLPDGRLLTAETDEVAGIDAYRFAADGTPDPASSETLNAALNVSDAKLRNDGRVVFGGVFVDGNIGFATLDKTSFELDNSFPSGSTTEVDAGVGGGQLGAIAITHDDRLIAAIGTRDRFGGCAIAVFSADGVSLDVLSSAPADTCVPHDVALDSTGYIAFAAGAVGGTSTTPPTTQLVVGMLAPDGGAQDWGNHGVATNANTPPTPKGGVAKGVVFDGVGRVVVVARVADDSVTIPGLGVLTLIRYTRTGTLDLTFNRTGYVSMRIGDGFDPVRVGIQNDGRIVVSGTASMNGQKVFALARYWP